MGRKLPPPVAKCRFADIESDTLLTQGFDDHVNVRIALMRVQRHRIPVLKRESIPCERPHRRLEFVSWRAPRHGEDEIVHELGGLTSVRDGSIGVAATDAQVQIPIVQQIVLKSSFHQPLAHVGFDFIQTFAPDIVEMGADALQVSERRRKP